MPKNLSIQNNYRIFWTIRLTVVLTTPTILVALESKPQTRSVTH